MEATEDILELKERLAVTETRAAMLDLLPMPIIQIDKDSIITYINPAGAMALGLFQQDDVVGMVCHDVLQTPQCQTGECLCYQTVHADDVISGETSIDPDGQKIPIQFTGIPIKDEAGNITGGLVFMLDISEELELTKEVLRLTEAVKEGDLSARGDVEKFEGNARQIIQSINDLLDEVIGPLDVIADYLERIVKGSLPSKIIDEFKGIFNKIKKNLNDLIDNLFSLNSTVQAIAAGDLSIPPNNLSKEESLVVSFEPMIEVTGQLVEELHAVTKAVRVGKLHVRGDVNKFQGEFAKVVRSVNSMLDAVVRPLNIVTEYVERIARGNIPGRITEEYKGDFNEIKKHLNQYVDVVNSLVTETVRLTEATSEGLLSIRGDTNKFQGSFAKIVHGINATLDAVTEPLDTAVEYMEQIAKGNIPGKIIDEYRGDFHKLKNTMNSLIDSFQEMMDIANAIAHGDMAVEVNMRSEDDVRLFAFQKMKTTVSQLVREIDLLKEAAVEGHLDIRGNANKFPGDFAKIVQGTNAALDAVVRPLNGVAEYIDRIANGNIPAKVTDEYKGDFRKFKISINHCIDAINDVISEVANLAETVARGDLDRRANLSKYTGDWATIVKGLNKTADNMATPIRDIGGVLNRMAAGEITAHVTFRYQGEYNVLKGACNELGVQLQDMRDVLVYLKTAAMNGQLDTRGNVQQFKGEFAGMVQEVNNVLHAVDGPVNLMSEYIACLAKGEIPEKIVDEYKGKFHELRENLNMLIDVTHATTLIPHSDSDLNLEMKARSFEDVCMMTGDGSENALNKNLNVIVAPNSEQDALNHSLRQFMINLQTMTDEVKRSIGEVQQQNWLRTGQVELSSILQGEQDSSALAKKIMAFLAKYVKAQVGALYLANRDNNTRNTIFQLVGSYAHTKRKSERSEFRLGEGLVGQAALEKESIVLTDVPEEYITARWSLSGKALRQIMVTPFIYEGEVKGVIELGTTREFTKNHLEFLERACESIAIAFNSAQARLKIQELLKDTQQQAEELQTQREQLRMSNEKLESQTRVLRESEQRLQHQQEELRQTNEQLSRQIKELEKQQVTEQQRNLALEQAQRLIEEKVKVLEQSHKQQPNVPDNTTQQLQLPLNNLQALLKLLEESRDGNFTEKQDKKAQLNIEEVNLRSLADYIEQNFTRMAVERGLYLKVDVEKGLPVSIHTDRKRVEQIVQNLLSNALNFTGQGGVSVQIARPATGTVVSHSGLALHAAIALSVSDTGIGFPEEKQRAISRAFQGTGDQPSNEIGSGLSSLQELTALLGGEIQLHSQEGKGSTFTLLFPESDVPHPSRLRYGCPDEHHSPPGRGRGGLSNETFDVHRRNFPQRPRLDDISESRSGERTGTTVSSDSRLKRDISNSSSEERVERPTLRRNKGSKDERRNIQGVERPVSRRIEENKVERTVVKGAKKSVERPVLSPSAKSIEKIHDDRFDLLPENKSMLIIEDEPEFAQALLDLARERGFKGLVAEDGTVGLLLAYEYIPSAIILNIGLLDADGWMIMEKLKANADTRNIPVHFLSTQDRTLDAVETGTVEYLTKPVTSAEALNTAFKKIEESLEIPIKSLLIVENDEPTQVGMVELLGGNNIEIITAATGKEVYQLLQTGPFDCMVLDLELPDISGFELLNMIKKNPKIAPFPIIVYTAKELTKREQKLLKKHSENSRIEEVKSQDRLLNEVESFLRQVESELPPEQQEKLRLPYDRDTVLNGKTLLLVDGDMRNIPSLTNMFEEKGLNVLYVEDGKEALKQLDIHPDIDLVLMDMMMPGMDGCKVTGEIRKQSRFKRLPVIALTERAIKDERKKYSEVGINDYLSKPIDTDKLLSVLRVWLY